MKKLLLTLILLFALQTHAQDVNILLKEVDSLSKIDKANYKIQSKLKKILKLEPRNEKALFKICEYYLITNFNHYADDYVDTLVEINPRKAENYWMRVQIKLRENTSLNELKQCIADLEIIIALIHKTPNRVLKAQITAYCLLSSKYKVLGNKESETIVDVSGLEDLKPNLKKAEYYKNAKTAFKQGILFYKELKIRNKDLTTQFNKQLYKCDFEEK